MVCFALVEGFGERKSQDIRIQDARAEGNTRRNQQNVTGGKTQDLKTQDTREEHETTMKKRKLRVSFLLLRLQVLRLVSITD
jgi:hypothetical protein